MRSSFWLSMAFLTAMLALSGCKGDDGAQGPAGPVGPPVAFTETAIETCIFCHGQTGDVPISATTGKHSGYIQTSTRNDISITAVDTTGGKLQVTALVTDWHKGTPVTNVTSSNIRFTFAQLNGAGTSASPAVWLPHLTRQDTPSAGGTAVTQGYYQRTNDSSGTLDTSQKAAGLYTWTFGVGTVATEGAFTLKTTATDNVLLSNVATYDATKPQRVGAQVGSGVSNAVFDFTPGPDGLQTATGRMDKGVVAAGTMSNQVVTTGACNACHNADGDGNGLALHGPGSGARRQVEYCVTCHNSTTFDADTGNSVDMRVFIHKIHRGKGLPSVVAGTAYKVASNDYSTGGFPQEVTNCTKCHTGGAKADNWKTVPTRAVCGSCHDDVDFAAGTKHAGGVQADDAACANCHPATGGTGGGIADKHRWPLILAEGNTWALTINSVDYVATTGELTVAFQAENPVGTPVALDGTAWTQGSASRLALSVGWKAHGKADYTNAATAQVTPGAPLNISVVTNGALESGITALGGNVYQAKTTLRADAQESGMGIVTLDGHPAVKTVATEDYDRIPVKNSFKEFAMKVAVPFPRRAVVDIAKCQVCHDTLTLHGQNRTDVVAVCTTCHNSANTDIARRPTDGTTPVDGKSEESIDFKRMIHRIHKGREAASGGITVYGFGGGANTFAGEFPVGSPLNNCNVCHIGSSYNLPLPVGLEGSTINSVGVLDQTDDLNITPTAATCSACHDSIVAQGHMKAQGASFEVTEAGILGY